MALSDQEKAYRDKHGAVRLTFDGVNDLYQTQHGAVTIARAIELEEVHRNYMRSLRAIPRQSDLRCSDELAIRNERCIDTYGCSMF